MPQLMTCFCLFVCVFVCFFLFVSLSLLLCLLLFCFYFYLFSFSLEFWGWGMVVEALIRKILGFLGGAGHYNVCWPEKLRSLLVWLGGEEIQSCNLRVWEN